MPVIILGTPLQLKVIRHLLPKEHSTPFVSRSLLRETDSCEPWSNISTMTGKTFIRCVTACCNSSECPVIRRGLSDYRFVVSDPFVVICANARAIISKFTRSI